MTQLDIRITLELSQGVRDVIERLIDVIEDINFEEEDNDGNNENDDSD